MKTFNDIINNYVTSPDFLNKNIEDLVMFAYKEGCVDTAFIYDQYGQIIEADREEFTKNLNPNGHDYVDLGLPSGTLWATMNIGATSPEQYGDYYNIYRVYFTKTKTFIVRIQNPFKKAENGEIEVYPTIYQMNFDASVIEKRYAQ